MVGPGARAGRAVKQGIIRGSWLKRFVRFCGLRHRGDLDATAVRGFLTHLMEDRNLSASTQQQALSALLFSVSRHVGSRPLEVLGRLQRVRVPTTLPVVLTADEVARVLASLQGAHRLVGLLLYGSGLRLMNASIPMSGPGSRGVHGARPILGLSASSDGAIGCFR